MILFALNMNLPGRYVPKNTKIEFTQLQGFVSICHPAILYSPIKKDP